MKELNSKSELEKIIRKLVEDTREEIYENEKQKSLNKKQSEELSTRAMSCLMKDKLKKDTTTTILTNRRYEEIASIGEDSTTPSSKNSNHQPNHINYHFLL